MCNYSDWYLSAHGLADFNATLGSDHWLGFITTGLSPDQKRLALLGAQRQGSAAGYRQRCFDFKVVVLIAIMLSTRGGQPVGSARLAATLSGEILENGSSFDALGR